MTDENDWSIAWLAMSSGHGRQTRVKYISIWEGTGHLMPRWNEVWGFWVHRVQSDPKGVWSWIIPICWLEYHISCCKINRRWCLLTCFRSLSVLGNLYQFCVIFICMKDKLREASSFSEGSKITSTHVEGVGAHFRFLFLTANKTTRN